VTALAAYAPTLLAVRAAIGPDLRALALFGSCLSPRTRRAGSIPDLFASVDDLDGVLGRLGVGVLGRWAARVLPPITLAFRGPGGTPLAKLNLIDPTTLAAALAARRDLYLAARLGKRVELAYARDAVCHDELEVAQSLAARTMAEVALLGRPRRWSRQHAIERCVTVSYEAEPRPETPTKVRALFDAFAAHYVARFGALVDAVAAERGLVLVDDAFVDERSSAVRAREARSLRRLLFRSRLRMMARWPKQALVYRGWLPYLVQKIRRARLA
jgi:hypothetical protein